MVKKNKVKTEPDTHEVIEITEQPNTIDLVNSSPKTKKKKKKGKKQESEAEVFHEEVQIKDEIDDQPYTSCNDTFDTSSQCSENDLPKKKKKKKKKLIEENEIAFVSVMEDLPKEKLNGLLEGSLEKTKTDEGAHSRFWPKEKLERLISQMETVLPKNDTLKYTSRLGRLDWKSVSFDEYSPEECQEMWRQIQAKVRCYRILKEILDEARGYIDKDLMLEKKNHDHPEMPPKPLSSFMLFYRDTKDKVLTDSPRLGVTEISKKISELWKSLNPKKIEKYKNKAAKLRQEYEEKMKIFYKEHPDVEQPAPKKPKPKADALGFTKPRSAFQLYHHSMRDKHPNMSPSELLDKCKNKWKNMSEKKKVAWIEAAQQEEELYRENLKKYQSEHPDYVAPPMKTLITKSDKHILNNISGKPKQPARNAYSLYSQESLQNGSLKDIPSKDRLAEISRRWKALDQSERDTYAARCEELQKIYKIEYQKYMDSLPAEKKLEELQRQTKRKKPESKDASKSKKIKLSEPIKPPENVFELFKMKHDNEWNKNSSVSIDEQALSKWKKLSNKERHLYADELSKLKDKYVYDMTEYIKHCDDSKIMEFVNIIASHAKTPIKTHDSSEDSESDSDSN